MRLPGKFVDNYNDDSGVFTGCGITPIGGLFVFLKTNDDLVTGNLVVMDSAVDDSVKLAPANSLNVIGVAAETAANGTIAKIVIAGRAQILLKAGTVPARNCMYYMSDTAGKANIAVLSGSWLSSRDHMIAYSLDNDSVSDLTEGILCISRYQDEETAIQLTDGANISVEANKGHHFYVTIAGDRQLDNPTNPRGDMQLMMIRVTQGVGGSHLLTYDTKYRFSALLPSPVLSTAAGKHDYLGFVYNLADDKWDYISQALTY